MYISHGFLNDSSDSSVPTSVSGGISVFPNVHPMGPREIRANVEGIKLLNMMKNNMDIRCVLIFNDISEKHS